MKASFLSNTIVNPLRVGVTINEKRALFWSKCTLCLVIGFGLGLSFTGKWWDFTVYKKRYFVSILNEKGVLNIRNGSV